MAFLGKVDLMIHTLEPSNEEVGPFIHLQSKQNLRKKSISGLKVGKN